MEWFGGPTISLPSNHRSQLFDAIMLANRQQSESDQDDVKW